MPIPESEIIGAAMALIEAHGFARAKAKVEELTVSWRGSTVSDAKDGREMWERIGAVIVEMEARLV